MVTGLDNQIYAVIGDTFENTVHFKMKLLEYLYPPDASNYRWIPVQYLRVDPEGSHYAMGIRNSFGLVNMILLLEIYGLLKMEMKILM